MRLVRAKRLDACPRILLSGTGSSSRHGVPSSEIHLQFGPQRLCVLRVSCLTRASSVEGNNSKPKQWPQVRQTVGSLKHRVGHRERERSCPVIEFPREALCVQSGQHKPAWFFPDT